MTTNLHCPKQANGSHLLPCLGTEQINPLFLKKSDGKWDQRIVVVVSHDRFFLDEVCTDTLHLSGIARRLTPSRGNYSLWRRRRQQLQREFKRRTDLRA